MRSRSLILCIVFLAGCSHALDPSSLPVAAQRRGIATGEIHAAGYRVIHNFGVTDGDGVEPYASLIAVNGKFYGTTIRAVGQLSEGAVFSVSTTGEEHVLRSFGRGHDAAAPYDSLIDVKGTLYGTGFDYAGNLAGGAAFGLSTAGKERMIVPIGEYAPYSIYGGLVYVNRRLYGTMIGGTAPQACGAIFGVSTTGADSGIVYTFKCGADGVNSYASLIDVNGKLYGTTVAGGANANGGTVFSVTTAGTESVLHSFGRGTDGAGPYASLLYVGGALYGTTTSGGVYKKGTVFSVNLSGPEQVLHSFGKGKDGTAPHASLIEVQGAFYGTTTAGGAYGKGTVFSLDMSGTEHVLHNFGKGKDGASPYGGLIALNGTLYGTTRNGGTRGDGTVFALRM